MLWRCLAGVYPPTSSLINSAADLSSVLVDLYSNAGSGPIGPVRKCWWNEWIPPENTLIWDKLESTTTGEEYCNRLTEIPDTSLLTLDGKQFALSPNVIGIIATCFAFTLIALVLYIWPHIRGTNNPFGLTFDTNGLIVDPRQTSMRFQTFLLFMFFFVVAICGGILFGIGYKQLFDLILAFCNWEATF
jgi:hypothetical protein